MPELPEVEVVRRGLAEHLPGRRIEGISVHDARSLRRHVPGPADLVGRLAGREFAAAARRGKLLWLRTGTRAAGGGAGVGDGPAEAGPETLLVHLGMSGQMLINPAGSPLPRHARLSAELNDGHRLDFVDQRLFGGWSLSEGEVESYGETIPAEVGHIAPDPFSPGMDVAAAARRMRASASPIKALLLRQDIVSGIGNIYADEALWRSQIHGGRRGNTLSLRAIRGLLDDARAVMSAALAQGGTSFDSLYINVNGESGYFARSLDAYGRTGEPCGRCGEPLERVVIGGRSSHFCPRCQRRPRR